MMNSLQYFSPQLVEIRESKFSGKLEVYKFQNKFFIKTGDVHQSGGWADTLFHNVNLEFRIKNLRLKNVLILGLAGGTIVNLLTHMYPYMNIVGVDIDPAIVDLGRKYFHLDEYKNLKIKIADAFNYIKHVQEKFDFVFVDLFKRDKVQLKSGDTVFLDDLLRATSENGWIMINRLYLPEFKKETDEYVEFLRKEEKNGHFKIQKVFQNFGNKVLLLQERR